MSEPLRFDADLVRRCDALLQRIQAIEPDFDPEQNAKVLCKKAFELFGEDDVDAVHVETAFIDMIGSGRSIAITDEGSIEIVDIYPLKDDEEDE